MRQRYRGPIPRPGEAAGSENLKEPTDERYIVIVEGIVPWIGTNAIDATTTGVLFTQVSGFKGPLSG